MFPFCSYARRTAVLAADADLHAPPRCRPDGGLALAQSRARARLDLSPLRLCGAGATLAAHHARRLAGEGREQDLAEGVDGKVLFAAFTGKAACVMRSKGCPSAATIHSLIYRARESGEETPSFELWDEAPASKA